MSALFTQVSFGVTVYNIYMYIYAGNNLGNACVLVVVAACV